MQKLGPYALGLVSLFVAGSAAANTTGQYGFTGRAGSCLECHGPEQFPGLSLEIGSVGETKDCWVRDDEESTEENLVLKKLELPTLEFNQTVPITVRIAEPEGDEAPACPISDCCGEDEPPAEAMCNDPDGFYLDDQNYHPQGTCIQFLDACDDGVVAGFNMEVVGGGAFALKEDESGVQLRTNGGAEIPTEVTHVRPARFEDGAITWEMNYTTPAEADYDDGLQFWVGANVANGNGKADRLDKNTNYQLSVALGDELPSYCAVCDDMGTLPGEDGTCGGCTCAAPGDAAPVSAAALALVGLFFFRRRKS